MIRALLALLSLSALACALCIAGGALMGAGLRSGGILAAIGAGWLGILYGHLIRSLKGRKQ